MPNPELVYEVDVIVPKETFKKLTEFLDLHGLEFRYSEPPRSIDEIEWAECNNFYTLH
jgi:hypothetical protein